MLESFFEKLEKGSVSEEKMEKLFEQVGEEVDWKSDTDVHELTDTQFHSILRFFKKKTHMDEVVLDITKDLALFSFILRFKLPRIGMLRLHITDYDFKE